jgi:hypothetical protein
MFILYSGSGFEKIPDPRQRLFNPKFIPDRSIPDPEGLKKHRTADKRVTVLKGFSKLVISKEQGKSVTLIFLINKVRYQKL